MSALAPVTDPRVPWFARMKRTPLVIVDAPPEELRHLPEYRLHKVEDRLRWVHPGRELTAVERAEFLLALGVIKRDEPELCYARRMTLRDALTGS